MDWKETPGKDEEISYEMLREKILMERMENVENVVIENVIIDTDSSTLSLCLNKNKTEEEEKTTIPHKYSVSMAEDQVVQSAAITTEGKYGINISRKLHNSEAAKVSGLATKVIITKPQQVYTRLGRSGT